MFALRCVQGQCSELLSKVRDIQPFMPSKQSKMTLNLWKEEFERKAKYSRNSVNILRSVSFLHRGVKNVKVVVVDGCVPFIQDT